MAVLLKAELEEDNATTALKTLAEVIEDHEKRNVVESGMCRKAVVELGGRAGRVWDEKERLWRRRKTRMESARELARTDSAVNDLVIDIDREMNERRGRHAAGSSMRAALAQLAEDDLHREALLVRGMTRLDFTWDERLMHWQRTPIARLKRVAVPAAVVAFCIVAVLAVFLVPTTQAAAARVAYLSAVVAILSAALPPIWRWARRT
jgi:hypothetical protein